MSLEQYENRIVRTRGKGTIAFELLEPDLFYMTGYKVIPNFTGGGLIPAYRSLLNGKTRLVYDLKDYEPLISIIDGIGSGRMLTLLQNLFNLCERIKENGFIQGEHVCLDEDMIFVDDTGSQVWLVYVPLRQRDSTTMELDSLEKQLVKLLTVMMASHRSVFDRCMGPVREYLGSGKCDISKIKELFLAAGAQKPETDSSRNDNRADDVISPESLLLERVGGTQPLMLKIPSAGAVIGRNDELSQIIIQDSSVSKKHCRIYKKDGRWMIEDLKSSNHTWIGESSEWLVPFKESEIHPGDMIHISRFVFQVKAGIGD